MKPETRFRKRVDVFLKSLENTTAESIQQASLRGTADKILCVHGWFVWMEIKTDEGDLTPLQTYKASNVRVKGKGIAFAARPGNWPQIMAFLTLLDKGVYDSTLLRAIGPTAVSSSSS